jgi:hypothetical protein
VNGERRRRILDAASSGTGEAALTARLCAAGAELIDVNGSGIMLMSGDVPRGSLYATNHVSKTIEDLQYALGEGPCVDAYVQSRVVIEPDLANPRTPRWFAFSPPAIQAGARAVFAFPLQVGTVRLGALDLYRDRPGTLSDDEHADALVLADLIAQSVLDTQAGAAPGDLASELAHGADFHFHVHNAAGMVSVQLGVSIAEALVRLRAYAFAHGRPLAEVADDVVARRLRLD